MSRVYHPATRDEYQPSRVRSRTVPAVIAAFHAAGWSYREIGLLVSGHAGHLVSVTTISAIANGRLNGERLARHFTALAQAWGML
jgi:hypothetical protein